MNYIDRINEFWKSHEEHSFSTTEIALYFHLLKICNSCKWKNPFKRRNDKIQADLSISYNTLKNARNKLSQADLLEFKSKNGDGNVQYTLSNFDEVTNEVTNEGADEGADEYNKEKSKNKKESKSNDLPKEKPIRFSPPTLEEVEAYCQERQNKVDADKFFNFYKSKGWMVGKNKMKDWEAAVRTWEKEDKQKGGKNGQQKQTGSNSNNQGNEDYIKDYVATAIANSSTKSD